MSGIDWKRGEPPKEKGKRWLVVATALNGPNAPKEGDDELCVAHYSRDDGGFVLCRLTGMKEDRPPTNLAITHWAEIDPLPNAKLRRLPRDQPA